MADNTVSFESLPDAEAARLMAEMDGWRVVKDGDDLIIVNDEHNNPLCRAGGRYGYEVIDTWLSVNAGANYPRSLDAAVGWLGRMGLEWRRWRRLDQICVAVAGDEKWFHCYESPDCPTSRALCNAGWQAVQAREASEA